MTLTPGITIRSAVESDAAGIELLLRTSFGFDSDEQRDAHNRVLFPRADAIVATDGTTIVGHVRSSQMTLTVPGEQTVPACGIAAVGVAPTHRRRGILRAMYTEQHRRTEADRLPLTIFTASEGTIYGRFGYGPTSRENAVAIDRRFAEFRPSTPNPGGVELIPVAAATEQIIAIYDRWRRLTPGAQVRPTDSWGMRFDDQPSAREGGTGLFALVHPDGYALYRYHHRESAMVAKVVEFHAVTTDAHAALWRVLFGLDLVEQVEATLTDNDPLPYLLTDPRLVRTTARYDSLWLRLMDIPAALTARSYQRDLEIVLGVTDPFRDAGGTFALTVRGGVADCAPTTRDADIELGIDVLGAYPARQFAAANRLQAKDSARLRALDDAFGCERDAELGWFF